MSRLSKKVGKASRPSSVGRAAAGAAALEPQTATTSARLYNWKQSFELVTVALAFVSANGKMLLKANDAFARLHGHEREALSGTSLAQLVAAHARARLTQHMRAAAEHHVYESRHRRSDGSTFRAQIDVTRIRDAAEKKVLYRVMHVQEITGQTRAVSRPDTAKQRAATPEARVQVSLPSFVTPLQGLTEHTNDVFWVCAVQRRRFPVGVNPTRQSAPAGSNRSNHGGNEMVEAFG